MRKLNENIGRKYKKDIEEKVRMLNSRLDKMYEMHKTDQLDLSGYITFNIYLILTLRSILDNLKTTSFSKTVEYLNILKKNEEVIPDLKIENHKTMFIYLMKEITDLFKILEG